MLSRLKKGCFSALLHQPPELRTAVVAAHCPEVYYSAHYSSLSVLSVSKSTYSQSHCSVWLTERRFALQPRVGGSAAKYSFFIFTTIWWPDHRFLSPFRLKNESYCSERQKYWLNRKNGLLTDLLLDFMADLLFEWMTLRNKLLICS